MNEISELLEGLAALSWPAIAFFLLWRFSGPIRSVIESASGRKFTIKVGENELTMEEATEQQRRQVADLQKQVAAFTPLETTKSPDLNKTDDEPDIQSADDSEISILWVDDQPRNNSYEIASLEDRGVSITTAISTEEGLDLFNQSKFDRVISDMGRREDGRSHGKAGIELTKKLRATGTSIPILIYCGTNAARALRREALEAGANEITSSPTALMRFLNLPN